MNPSFSIHSLEEEEFTETLSAPNNYGSLIPLLPDRKGNPRVMLGPHYPIFVTALSFSVLLFGWMIYYYFNQYTFIWKVLVIGSNSSFLLIYLWMGLSKPGFQLSSGRATLSQRLSQRYCSICDIVRERRTQHCQMCNVCIAGYDHHCPWVGKCVGRGNIKTFYCFLVATFGNLLVIFVATATLNIENQFKKVAV